MNNMFNICGILLMCLMGFFSETETKHHHHSQKHSSTHEWEYSPRVHHKKSHHRDSTTAIEGRQIMTRKGAQKIQSLDEFRTDGLRCHNEYRALHGTPPLQLDEGLNELALDWAEEIAEGSDAVRQPVLTHTPAAKDWGGVGDNIFLKKGNTDVTAQFACDWWYNKIRFMDWNDNQYNWKTGYFTQFIWKATRKLGLAKVKSPRMGYSVIVATYVPRGNMNYKKAYAENVLPPLKPRKIHPQGSYPEERYSGEIYSEEAHSEEMDSGPERPYRGPQGPYSGPQRPFNGPQGPYSGPTRPFNGPQRPPYSGPPRPYPGHSRPYPGPPRPYPGHSRPYPGPPRPYNGPQRPYARPPPLPQKPYIPLILD